MSTDNDCFHQKRSKLKFFPLKNWTLVKTWFYRSSDRLTVSPQGHHLGLGWPESGRGKDCSRARPSTWFSVQVSALLMTQLAVLGHSSCILSQLMKGKKPHPNLISFYSKCKWKRNSSFSKESSPCSANTVDQQHTQNSKQPHQAATATISQGKYLFQFYTLKWS